MSEKRKKRVALSTLGCKVNQFESAAFLSGFEKGGVEIVPFSQEADVYIVNTCAVTAKAAAQSRQQIRRAGKTNPGARVVVTGCYAQIGTDEILKIGEGLTVIGNSHKNGLVDEVLADLRPNGERVLVGDISCRQEPATLQATTFGDRTRAYLKIQDGCNNFCSYCIVPYARGRSRSQAPDEVLEQARIYAANGYRELVVTGIHTGLYGQDLDPVIDLATLLRRLLAEHPLRYRISSLEPGEVSAELLELMAVEENLMPHLHIPLQSGDDRILQSMGRRYRRDDFAELVNRCKKMMPEMAIGVDVLVGYPGENDSAFRNTCELLEGLAVSYLHVFPYSKRPGTRAAEMSGQVPQQIKDERVAILRDLSVRKRREFYRSQIGTVRSALVERGSREKKLMQGFTDNYIPVSFPGTSGDANRLCAIRIDRVEEDAAVFGTVQEG
ncbi:MAG: tRNA (N(6)-L-threonylcarbamoyladenosine(37)-C(2))-methylthiotransferase MtaB [Proteobacteria bacterium]|nr:tRNA (N(6)-L-threonylcarbamoyladenosine(37)-C(2))-methylthiotransferase MtaB [Pseudomonadota bacterium]MBU1738831.1 tRNA (N(6)-L-threonylcarbamoyladenosine(37)-C(2))-methylthiotransferase MtaB [Pseudomonadota bacterium]